MEKAIFWDFDNTLAFRDGKWTQSLVNVLENNGYTDPYRDKISPHFRTALPWNRWEEAHKDYFEGKNWWDFVNGVIAHAVKSAGIPEREILKLAEQFRNEYLRIEAWRLFKETIVNLEKSKALGFSNVIVSNHTPELIWLTEQLGIAPYFDLILSSAIVGYDKPHPLIYEKAEQQNRYEQIYMVGDNFTADVMGGNLQRYISILVRGDNPNGYGHFANDLDGIWQFID
jgi:HAD superfamily hydrolase (TIGR01549 family)